MTDKQLLNSVAKLGLPMFEPEEEFDVNETLAQVVKSREARLWEGFPVLLANAANDYRFSLDQVKRMLNRGQLGQLQRLVLLSLAVYDVQNLTLPWASKVLKTGFWLNSGATNWPTIKRLPGMMLSLTHNA